MGSHRTELPKSKMNSRNFDYVPNNIRANSIKTKLVSNNIKMKLVSNNIKIKPNTRLNNRTHETLFVIFILFPVNLLNYE